MLDINEQLSKLESLESEIERTVQEKESLEQQGTELLKALQELSGDIEVANLVNEYNRENQENQQEANTALNNFREEVETIKNDLSEFIDATNKSIEKVQELSDLDINVTESLAVLEERKTLIEECTRQLNAVLEKLNMSGFTGQVTENAEGEAAEKSDDSDNHNPKFKPINGDQNDNKNDDGSDPGSGGGPLNDPVTYFDRAMIRGPMPNGYLDCLWNRYDQGEENVKRAFRNLSERIDIQSTMNPANRSNYYLPAPYPGFDRGIYLNAVNDAADTKMKGAGTAFWHETGHMIDHASKGFSDWSSHDYSFGTALYNDAQRFYNEYKQMQPEVKKSIDNYLFSGTGHSLSDLLDAITVGQISGGSGHKREYWNKPWAVEEEAFAHFYEASMGGGIKLSMLQYVFSDSFVVFNQIIDDIGGGLPKLTLKKVL